MSDYTPTTRDLRVSWVEMRADGNEDIEPAQAEFDRWFAEELRKAKEGAWKEGMNYAMPPDAVLLYSDNPYRKGE